MPVQATHWCGHCELCYNRASQQRRRAHLKGAAAPHPQRPSATAKHAPSPPWMGPELAPDPEEVELVIMGPSWYD
jgi:hypothetical protein